MTPAENAPLPTFNNAYIERIVALGPDQVGATTYALAVEVQQLRTAIDGMADNNSPHDAQASAEWWSEQW